MKDIEARVLANRQVSSTFYVLTLEAAELEPVEPGQFVQVQCRKPWETTPFLRRPFSVMEQRGAQIDLVYKVIGPGTIYMSNLKCDETVSILGPMGKGFHLDRTGSTEGHSKTLIIAGGTGLGGIYYLAKTLVKKGISAQLLYGVRFREEVATEALDSLAIPYKVIVEKEDGYMTDKGLPELNLNDFDHCCICGPTPMMKATADYVKSSIKNVEVSLEEMMGCGFGICYTCPVKRSDCDSYYGACYDGPVFRHESIVL
jgi:dihydroorotate dehydrogenase electron transfer subunit